MRIIGIAGSKGGVGVTTVVAQLATTLAIQGYETLVVEVNRNGGCTDLLGVPPSPPSRTVSCQLEEGVFTESRPLDGLPEFRLVDARPDVDLFASLPEEGALTRCISSLADPPEIVLVDMASTLDPLARWAMGECDEVIIVVQPAGLSVRPVPSMVEVIEESGTVFGGLLINHYGGMGRTGRDCIQELEELFEEWLLPVQIPATESLQKAAMNGNSIFWEDGRSEAARAFKALAEIVTVDDEPMALASAQ